MNPGYPDIFVICGGFLIDSAIPMKKKFNLMVNKLCSSKPNTAIFFCCPLFTYFYITALWYHPIP